MNIKRGDLVRVKATGLIARVDKIFYRRAGLIEHLINGWDHNTTVDQHTVRIKYNGPMQMKYYQPNQLKVLSRR